MQKQSRNSAKKGNPSWKPAARLDVSNKSKDFRYRWVHDEQANIDKKIAEGWVFVDKETGIPGEHVRPTRVEDGKPLDSTKKYADMVLMALPENLAKARDEYFRKQTERQTIDLKRQAEESIKGAEVTGKIVID